MPFTLRSSLLSSGASDVSSLSHCSLSSFVDDGAFQRHKIPLKGRRPQVKLLLDTYQSVLTSGKSEIVFLSAPHGVGETALLDVLQGPVSKDNGHFCRGKFDPLQRGDPYSAVIEAFTQLLTSMRQCETDIVEQVKSNLQNKLASSGGIGILANLIPGLELFLDTEEDAAYKHTSDTIKGQAFLRFRMVCQTFLRAMATRRHPIVLVLEDIEHSDDPTLEVIETLLSDPRSKNIMFLCTYKDVEKRSSKLKSLITRPFKLHKTHIQLQPLELTYINEVVADLLSMEPLGTMPLAEVIDEKAAGDPLFVSQILKLLQSSGAIERLSSSSKWTWDLDNCKAEIRNAENMIDTVLMRAERLPPQCRDILKFAAVIGSKFENIALAKIVSAFLGPTVELESLLEAAKDEGIIAPTAESRRVWQFCHDQARMAFYYLLDTPRERKRAHLRVGQTLKSWKGALSFIATDHCNMGSSLLSNNTEKQELAETNLAVGRQALNLSAYGRASTYFSEGIVLLLEWGWKSSYDLMLNLHVECASADHCTGDSEACQERVAAIIKHARVHDKTKAYRVMVESFCVQKRYPEAIQLGLRTLRKLQVKIPTHWNRVSVFFNLLKTKQRLERRTVDEMLMLPVMGEGTRLAVMSLLSSVLTCAVLSEAKEVAAVVAMKIIRSTLKYGYNGFAPEASAVYGVLLKTMGNSDRAYQCGSVALKLLSKGRSAREEAHALLIVHGYLHYLKRPIEDSFESLIQVYKTGMAGGDIEYAVSACLYASTILYQRGEKLDTIVQLLEDCHTRLTELRYKSLSVTVAPMLQSLRSLMDEAPETKKSEDEIPDREALTRDSMDSKQFQLAYSIQVNAFYLSCWMFQWDSSSKTLEELLKIRKHIKMIGAHFLNSFFLFFWCLSDFAHYRRSNNSKFLKRGLQTLKDMEKMWADGIQAYEPLIPLLQAERVVLQTKDQDEALRHFSTAISAAESFEAIHLNAVANERAGDAVLHHFNDAEKAVSYWNQARALYEAWGASAKLFEIDSKIESLANQ